MLVDKNRSCRQKDNWQGSSSLVLYYWWHINWWDHVLMSHNAPPPKKAVNISEWIQQCVSHIREKPFSPSKDKQNFSNRFYRYNYTTVNNMQSGRQQWLFPQHLCGSLLLLQCLQRGVWVLTAIYWISLKPWPPTTITGHLLGGGAYDLRLPSKGA